jgi:hypothetical protein
MSNTRHTPRPQNPARAEATGEGLSIEFRGYTYKIPPSSKWDLDAIEASERGNVVISTKLLLGEAQWAKFRERNSTLGDLNAFMDAITDVSGGNQ